MKRATLASAGIAAALVVGMGVAPAWAYFTDSTYATGGIAINVQPATDIQETYGSGTKNVVVTNAADATSPVFVRARVYSALPVSVGGSGWSAAADGWYLYDAQVAPGGQTDALQVSIAFPAVKSGDDAAGAVMGDNRNVVVVYESTPVRYDAQGNASADWEFILDAGTVEGGE